MNIRQTLTFSLLATLLGSSVALAEEASTGTLAVQESTPVVQNNARFSSDQIEEIQKIVHDYLVQNPKVLVEASQELQKQSRVQEEEYAQQAIQKHTQSLFRDANSPIAGNPKGTVTLVEFFDYQCGHCKEMNSIVKNLINKNKNLRVIYKELPVFGGESHYAAQVALASVNQGKYKAYHDALLDTENPLDKKKVFATAKSIGISISRLKKEMSDPKIEKQIRDNFKLAQALHLIGTPTFVISNQGMTKFEFIPGATSERDLQSKLEQVQK